jgi:hypothetical protein
VPASEGGREGWLCYDMPPRSGREGLRRVVRVAGGGACGKPIRRERGTMSRNRAILIIAIVGLVVLAGVWYTRRGRETPAVIDPMQKFATADKQPPIDASPDVFAVRDEKIGGEMKRSIYAYPPTRIIWHVTLPNDAWLRTSMGVDEQAWNKEGDGVLFLTGISSEGRYDPLLEQRLDPHASRADRRWIPVMLDLSQYGGKRVDIIFNTRVSVRGNDARNDFAYWGAPAVCLRP